jgi:DNA-binding transcriptional LysR family regulator
VLRLFSLMMVRDAVLAGSGTAVLPLSMVAHDLKVSRLANWGAAEGRPVTIWALHTSRRLVSSKLTAFVGFIADAFSDATLRPEG